MASRFSIETIFKGVDRMTAPVKRMEKGVKGFAKSTERSILRTNKRLGSMVSSAKNAALGTVVALAPIGFTLKDIIETGAQFEQNLVNAAAKFPGEIRKGTEEFELLEQTARRVGRETEFKATQAAEGLNFLAMAGFNAQQAVSALPGVVDLATAASIDLATASDIATDSLGAFGLMTKDATQLGTNLARINDVIAKTTTSANTNVEQMFEAIRDGAPVARAANADLETTATLIGKMADAGIKGTKAGTALKRIFLAIGAPSSKGAAALRELGVETTNADGSIRDIIDIMQDMQGAFKGITQAQRLSVLDAIFGKIPAAAAINLIEGAGDEMRAYRDTLRESEGAASKMANVMRDTLQNRFKTLGSAIESAKISTFALTEGPLADVVDRMTEWVRANETLIAQNIGGFLLAIIDNLHIIIPLVKILAAAFGILVAAFVAMKVVAVVIIVFKVLLFIFAALKIAAIALGIAFLILTSPIGLIILAVGALIGLAVLLIKKWEPVKEFFAGLFDSIASITSSALGAVGRFFGFGGDDENENRNAGGPPQMVSPSERNARQIEETRNTSIADITIKDETGRAELTQSGAPFPGGLQLQKTGAF